MGFFFDYIVPFVLLYMLLQLLMIPGALVRFLIKPPRLDR